MTELFESKPEWLKKSEGRQEASINHGLCLETARRLAASLSNQKGVISIDDVREGLINEGYDLTGLVKWLGSVFLCPDFVPAGFKQAEHSGSHGRIIRLWRLK